MSAAENAHSYHLCAGARLDMLPCSRIVSNGGDYCPNHIHQAVTLACDCDGCADFAAILNGPSRLRPGRSK